uniref:Uncharacterized protein n=1 Tax=Arundo donax TaxID=35708 RepID=A0A0A9A9L7_ARUDO
MLELKWRRMGAWKINLGDGITSAWKEIKDWVQLTMVWWWHVGNYVLSKRLFDLIWYVRFCIIL